MPKSRKLQSWLKSILDAAKRGHSADKALGILTRASETLRIAKQGLPEIEQHETSVAETTNLLRAEQRHVDSVTTAHSHMQRALNTVNSPSNVAAVASTQQALNQATLALRAAQKAWTAAQDELTKAQFPLQLPIDLVETLAELHRQAEICDRYVRSH